MNRQELLNFHTLVCDKARELMKRKNHDYAGKGDQEPFANFTRCEAMGICTTEAGFLVRLTDKMSRLSTFVDGGVLLVKDENVNDTLLDIINYAILFGAFIESKKPQPAKEQ